MSKKILFIFGLLFFSYNSFAAEAETTADEASSLRANFKRVALDISSTQVKNAQKYQNSPDSKLSADGETVMKGVFDFILEYEQPTYQWNNSVFMEYGKTKLKPAFGESKTSENSDKILLTTDYAKKMWRYYDADVGPFGSLGYQTEFERNEDAPRTKTFRGKAGIKMFNGKYIKELYAAMVEEYDMTYSQDDTKTAYEIGLKADYPVRDGVKFQLETYFRDYFVYSRYQGTDFKYEYSLTARLDVKLNNTISMAPFVQYFQAQDRQTNEYGSNLLIGVSLAYADLFNL